jgi:septal ring factor EnvC (AmiA/AmiB activator)
MAGVKGRSGGRRIGAGRKPKPRPAPSIAEVAPEIRAELTGLRALIEAQHNTIKAQRAEIEETRADVEAQRADIAHLRRQRRDEGEHQQIVLRQLAELTRLVRGDPGLTRPPRHTRARPLGVE